MMMRDTMITRLRVALIASLAWVPVAGAQPITGDVVAVGFRASTTSGTGLVARAGCWTPIQVQLRVQGSRSFQGQLRTEAPDLDGDLVSYIETPVAVTPDMIKRAWCYAVWQQDPAAASVAIVTDEGLPIARLQVPSVDLLRGDTMMIVDLSEKPLTKLRTLETPGWTPGYAGYGARPYYRDVLIATARADDLPDRWYGLEAADVVVWDEPDAARVSLAQLKALFTWVHNGGQLVVGLGQSWPAVQKSELAEILPVQALSGGTPAGQAAPALTQDVERLEGFFRQFALSPGGEAARAERKFSAPIPVALVEAKPGALRAMRAIVPGGPAVDLFTVQCSGAGRVIAVAASLRDLLAVPVEQAFYAQLFDLNPTTKKFRDSERESWQVAVGSGLRALYDPVVEPTSFKGWSGVLVLAAFAFVVAYVLVATLASWWWLQHHRLATWSWSVFAVFAMAASLLSLGTVSVLHGVSRGVRMCSLIDLEAGAKAALAKCYFGYSSPSRLPVDLTVPSAGGFLRPMARAPGAAGSYATPRRYSAIPAKALLQEAPRRATLKQFEGFWTGELSGSIRADLLVDRGTGELTPGSWIQNDLDVDLVSGYLLYVDPRFQDDDYPTRAAGKTTNWWTNPVPAAMNVLAVGVPRMAAGQKVAALGQGHYAQVQRDQARWAARADGKLADRPDLATLWREQQYWIGAEAASLAAPQAYLDATSRAALLASTRGFYLHCQKDQDKLNNLPISTEGLMNCDVSHWLMQGRIKAPPSQPDDLLGGQAVLLLVAEEPGPARLYGNGDPLGSVTGVSLYRVRVPISFQGSPPPPPLRGDREP